MRITGQVPWNGPAADEPLPGELDAFLASGDAPVVFTLGSSAVAAAGDFYDQSVKAVRRLGVRAVLLTGSHAENQPAEPQGDDVLPVAWTRCWAIDDTRSVPPRSPPSCAARTASPRRATLSRL